MSDPNIHFTVSSAPAQRETILVIDDEESIRSLLCEYLAMENFPVLMAANGQEGIELFRTHRPSIVVTDVRMPGTDGMGVLRAVRREDPEAKVVIMTGYGDGAVAVEALRAGASNYIKKPLSLEELLFIIGAHERMIQAQRRRRLPPGALVEERKILELGCDTSQTSAIVHNVVQSLVGHLPPQDIESVSLALSEALINAIEHGSLGIGYQDKSQALRKGQYQQLITQCQNDPELSRRKVRLEFTMTSESASCPRAAEGAGFDWRNLPDPTDPENLMREHGRGLSIIALFMDEVDFNDSGNRITMHKQFPQAVEQ